MTMTERADLVVVGAGTIGGWASYFAKTDGRRAGRRPRAGPRRAWAPARGRRHRPGPGRDAGDRRARSLVDRLLPRPARGASAPTPGFRELGYLILAVTEDDERAGRERVAMQRREGLDVRWLDAAEAAALDPDASPRRPPRRQLPRDRRLHRPAAQRPRLLAGDAGGRRRAPRADRVHRPAHRADRAADIAGRRRRDDRRADRDRAGPADRRPEPARRRSSSPASGSRPAPRATRSRSSSRTRRSTSSGCRWSSTSAPASTGGSRRAASCSDGAIPDEAPGEARAIDWPFVRAAARAARRRSCRSPAASGLRRIWAATIDYTPDHLPILGPALTPDGERIDGVTVASAGGHGMMWGPGVARVAADLALAARPT